MTAAALRESVEHASSLQVTRGDRVRIVPVIEESSTLPSVVSFLDSGECLVGPAAKRYEPGKCYAAHMRPCSKKCASVPDPGVQCRRVRKDPLNTFYSVKSFIGRALADVGQGAERVNG